jgi:hypothetical protein
MKALRLLARFVGVRNVLRQKLCQKELIRKRKRSYLSKTERYG